MRLALAALLVAAALAGCAEDIRDCDEEADADCVDPTAAPGVRQDCLSSASVSTSPTNNQGFAVQQGTAHGSNQCIDVDVQWRACEEGYCANATARNNGTTTVQVSSICVNPWEDRMADEDGNPVHHREPMAVCLAYGRAPFAPGDVAYGNFSWDGHLYSADGDDQGMAPAGAYTWSIVFWWDDGQGGGRGEASADIQLLVGIPT